MGLGLVPHPGAPVSPVSELPRIALHVWPQFLIPPWPGDCTTLNTPSSRGCKWLQRDESLVELCSLSLWFPSRQQEGHREDLLLMMFRWHWLSSLFVDHGHHSCYDVFVADVAYPVEGVEFASIYYLNSWFITKNILGEVFRSEESWRGWKRSSRLLRDKEHIIDKLRHQMHIASHHWSFVSSRINKLLCTVNLTMCVQRVLHPLSLKRGSAFG